MGILGTHFWHIFLTKMLPNIIFLNDVSLNKQHLSSKKWTHKKLVENNLSPPYETTVLYSKALGLVSSSI